MNNRITPYRYRTMQLRPSRRLLGVALSLTVVAAGSAIPVASAGGGPTESHHFQGEFGRSSDTSQPRV